MNYKADFKKKHLYFKVEMRSTRVKGGVHTKMKMYLERNLNGFLKK